MENLKILIGSHASLNDLAASSQLIKKIFVNSSLNSPTNSILSFYVSSTITLHNDDSFQITRNTFSKNIERINIFSPDICYFYLFANIVYLEFVLKILQKLNSVYIIHIMDDFLESERLLDYKKYLQLYILVEKIIQKANVCYAISEKMAEHFSQLFKTKFFVLHNFQTKKEIHRTASIEFKKNKNFYKILYSGGVTDKFNSDSLKSFAHVVSQLSTQIPLLFEIRTIYRDYNKIISWTKEFNNLQITCIDETDSYVQSLLSANLLLFSQNFKQETINFMRYSLGNKLPEYLATQVPIIAYGPKEITTFSYLKQKNAAICLFEENKEKLANILTSLYEKKIDLKKIQKNAQMLLMSEFLEDKQLFSFENVLYALLPKKINDKQRNSSLNKYTVVGVHDFYPSKSIIHEFGKRKQGIFKQSLLNRPLVTVITVVKNAEKTIQQTIDSIKYQTYKNIEYILIDGASTDNTINIIKENQDSVDYCISEPDSSMYDAMNKGLSLSHGDYIIILNADDYFSLTAIENLLNNAIKTNCDISYGIMHKVDQFGKFLNICHNYNADDKIYIWGMIMCHEASLISARTYNTFGYYDLKYKLASDYAYFLNAHDKKATFSKIDEVVVYFRNTGISNTNKEKYLEEQSKLRKNFFPFIEEEDDDMLLDCCKITSINLLHLLEKYKMYDRRLESALYCLLYEEGKLYKDFNKLLHRAIIIGNGSSLCGFDFKNKLKGVPTFGMNAAYRYWDRINWYPDYYCCLDLVVGLSHKNEIKRIIENSDEYGIKKFLLRDNLIQEIGEIKNKYKIINFENINKNFCFLTESKITTGSHTAAWAAEMGFQNIILLGMDSNYVEVLPEASSYEPNKLVIQETPKHNPNYFFDDYQQKGDKYHVPNTNPQSMTHRISWKNLSHTFAKYDILVINANLQSKLEYYHKIEFDKANKYITQIREQKSILTSIEVPNNSKFNEDDILMNYFADFKGTMIEVGTHYGSDTAKYLALGWKVHGFEPDENNRTICAAKNIFNKNFTLNSFAVSDISEKEVDFFTSNESTGISSMNAFHSTHTLTKKVKTITLKDYIKKEKIQKVDCLRIDTEGFDLMVLKGFPFEKMQPEVILCKFEDNKTLSLGYSTVDMIRFLEDKDYTVYVSEWCPILKYGTPHAWKQLFKAPGILFSPNSWGNLLAFKKDPGEEKIKELALQKPKIPPITEQKLTLPKLITLNYVNSLKKLCQYNRFKDQADIKRKAIDTYIKSIGIHSKEFYFFKLPVFKILKNQTEKYLLLDTIPLYAKIKAPKEYRFTLFGLQLFRKIKSKEHWRLYILWLEVFRISYKK